MVKKNKNLLPLLAITGIFLSVGLVSFTQSLEVKSVSTQSVLSKSTEALKSPMPAKTTTSKQRTGTKTSVRAEVEHSPTPTPTQKPKESLMRRMWLSITNKTSN